MNVTEPKLGGDVHDPRAGRLAQQRQHRVSDGDDAEHVGLQDRAQALQLSLARRPAPRRDTRVVNEDVEVSVIAVDDGRRRRDQAGVGDIEMEEADDVAAFGPQGLLGLLAPLDVARADQDGEAPCGKGAGGLEPDPLVCSGDEHCLWHATRVGPFGFRGERRGEAMTGSTSPRERGRDPAAPSGGMLGQW